jgi:hypothetical protein
MARRYTPIAVQAGLLASFASMSPVPSSRLGQRYSVRADPSYARDLGPPLIQFLGFLAIPIAVNALRSDAG